MDSKLTIEIDGKEYPCRQTMGASLRFKEDTGLELNEVKANDLTNFCRYLYYCVVSSCNRDKIPFDMSLIDFADSVDVEDLGKLGEQLAAKTDQQRKSIEKKRK